MIDLRDQNISRNITLFFHSFANEWVFQIYKFRSRLPNHRICRMAKFMIPSHEHSPSSLALLMLRFYVR